MNGQLERLRRGGCGTIEFLIYILAVTAASVEVLTWNYKSNLNNILIEKGQFAAAATITS